MRQAFDWGVTVLLNQPGSTATNKAIVRSYLDRLNPNLDKLLQNLAIYLDTVLASINRTIDQDQNLAYTLRVTNAIQIKDAEKRQKRIKNFLQLLCIAETAAEKTEKEAEYQRKINEVVAKYQNKKTLLPRLRDNYHSFLGSEEFIKFFYLSSSEAVENRNKMKAFRKSLYEEYGSAAVKRFDNHFAYTYRTERPLTTASVVAFLEHEDDLTKNKPVTTINLNELDTALITKSGLKAALLKKVTDLAAVEFEKVYPAIENDDDRVLLFNEFIKDFIQRPLDVVKEQLPEIEYRGFFTSRLFYPIYTFLFPGNNKASNKAAENLMKKLVLSTHSEKGEVHDIVKNKLSSIKSKDEDTLTLTDVYILEDQVQNLIKENDTVWNNWVRPWVIRPITNFLYPAAAAMSVANAPDPVTAIFSGLGLGAGAIFMSPEQKLMTSLGLFYSSKKSDPNNPSWFSTALKELIFL